MGLLDGRVAIITGAGGGIGRCHALLFAAEGAKVVVNDLGGTRAGKGTSAAMADQVVAEIKAAGGEAIASYTSVADKAGAEAIVKTAVEAFGRADILVNNAGILRDKTLLKLEESHWDLVIAVHLKGTFLCTQAFMQHVKERSDAGDPGGSVLNTSSYAGLKGNFGQSNYSGAKAGIAGLTRTWALEFARLGVNVNAVAPMAKTRMTDDIAMIPDEMTAAQISPMVLYLCSELGQGVNGQIFGVHGQQLFEYKMVMTDGATKEGSALWTAHEIHESLARITASEATPPNVPAAAKTLCPREIVDLAFSQMTQVFIPEKAKGWDANIQFELAGGENWTVIVEAGLCHTVKALEGQASCKVTADVETWAEIVTGKEKPEKAFMAGKVTATNLGDMMKLGGAFDMKKAARLLAETRSAPMDSATPEPVGPARAIDQAFEQMPAVFVPEKAKGWSAVIHFEIADANDWTISVANGTCKTTLGLTETATCTVTVDAETWAAIMTGKEKPEKAFMAGKVTATNLGDMMKLGGAFDMKKAAALAGSAQRSATLPAPATAEQSPAQAVDEAFRRMPEVFIPERAQGWKGTIHFQISDGNDWTIIVSDGQCETKPGLEGSATCVVTTSAATWSDIVLGKEKPEKAFMAGKVTATNLGDMMKLGTAFDMKKAAALAAEAGPPAKDSSAKTSPAQSPTPEPEPKGLNRDYIGRRFSGGLAWVKATDSEAYALATNDENPRYFGSEAAAKQVAPVLFPVRLFKEVLFDIMTEPGLRCDLLRLVHGEQEMEFFAALEPGDLVAMRASVTGIEDKSSGQLLHVQSRLYREGEMVCRARSTMFIRDLEKRSDSEGRHTSAAPEERDEPSFSATISVSEDQSLRYADASLDNNPIHTDRAVAKIAGLPDVILQGLCTMAFTSQAIVKNACSGDPTRLKSLSVRFSKPVLNGNTVTTRGWRQSKTDGETRYSFEATNQNGEAVIENGSAVVV